MSRNAKFIHVEKQKQKKQQCFGKWTVSIYCISHSLSLSVVRAKNVGLFRINAHYGRRLAKAQNYLIEDLNHDVKFDL